MALHFTANIWEEWIPQIPMSDVTELICVTNVVLATSHK